MAAREIDFYGIRMRVLLGEEVGAGLTVLEETVPPGVSAPPHAHLGISETFYVLEGSYRFVIDGNEHTVDAGGLATVTAGATHWWTSGPTGARSLILFSPGGMEGYFIELAEAIQVADDAPLDPAFQERMRKRYGMDLRV